MKEVLIFSDENSSRLDYVLNFISELLGISMHITSDETFFNLSKSAKINYSYLQRDAVNILPHTLLFEKGIKDFEFEELENDPLAQIFFMLSRYEEYLPFAPDKFGRFQARSSWLKKTERLHQPFADILVYRLKSELETQYPDLKFSPQKFSKQLTVDIDQVFKFKNKSFKRFVGAGLRDAAKLRLQNLVKRKLVYFSLIKDPWNIYEKLKIQLKDNKPVFFFHTGDYGEFDKNLPVTNPAFRRVIRETDEWADVGLHPSYLSNEDEEIVKMEKRRLETVIGRKITKSRQHYIKLIFPETYQRLLRCGFSEDYTMGYADETGFRAGTSHSFFWYDLDRELQTDLLIHPYCIMDVTLKDYMKMSWEHADFVLKSFYNEVQKVNGTFIIVTHNESLSGDGEWKGWDTVFLDFINS